MHAICEQTYAEADDPEPPSRFHHVGQQQCARGKYGGVEEVVDAESEDIAVDG